jgi:hypothetical protein
MTDNQTEQTVNETIEVEARDSSVTTNSALTVIADPEQSDAAIHIDPDADGDGYLSISTFVNIQHGDEKLEVAGYFEIHDEADARRLAAAVLAPFEHGRVRSITAAVERFFTASDHEDVVALRDRIVELGAEIERRVPGGRNKALALTALEDVQMRGNRGLFAPEHLR